jgi:hypothetical protein
MLDWIKKRAAQARKQERITQWQAHKTRLIESHSHEFFGKLSSLMAKSVEAFNEEFPDTTRRIGSFHRGPTRFVVERDHGSAVRLECRLDYARHIVRYKLARTMALKGMKPRTFHSDGSLEFDVSAKNEILLKSADAVPMTIEQVSQFLLDPFFEF